MKLKKIVADTLKYWCVYILSFCVVEIINLGVLSYFIPPKVCFWISAAIVLLFSGYLYLAISVVYDNLRMLLRKKENEWNQTIDELKKHIDKLDEENKELSRELTKSLSEDIGSGNDAVIRTIQTDLVDSKGCIINEVHEGSSALTKIVNECAKILLEKSDSLIELQDNCTEKIINNEKAIAAENLELVKGKVDFLAEQSSTLTKELSVELKNVSKENVAAVKSIDEKIDEKFMQTNESIKTRNAVIMQMLEDNQIGLNAELEHVNEEIAKGLKKTDDIIAIGNSIIEKQQVAAEENKKEFANICEQHNIQFADVKEVLCASIAETSKKEIKEILNCKEKLSDGISEVAKGQVAIKEELEAKLVEKVRELLQKSSGEITEHIDTGISELNTYHRETKEIYAANTETLEKNIAALHSETTKLINLLRDNIEDSSEKNERYINLLGDQISDLSKQSKNRMSELLSEVEKSKEQAERIANKLEEYAVEQKKAVSDSEKSLHEHIKSLSDFYSNYFNKIDNIQSEIRSISYATNLLNSLYSKLQESIKENNEKNVYAGKEKAERVEEYKDPESGVVVKNHYKWDKLSFSEMIVAGRKTYDVQYDSEGKAEKSRNYNEHGEIISEIEFYKNGQVKVRKEVLLKNGKKETVTSRFDEKGNKIK